MYSVQLSLEYVVEIGMVGNNVIGGELKALDVCGRES